MSFSASRPGQLWWAVPDGPAAFLLWCRAFRFFFLGGGVGFSLLALGSSGLGLRAWVSFRALVELGFGGIKHAKSQTQTFMLCCLFKP